MQTVSFKQLYFTTFTYITKKKKNTQKTTKIHDKNLRVNYMIYVLSYSFESLTLILLMRFFRDHRPEK